MKTVTCPVCKHTGPPKRVTPGSFWIEVVLWLFFIIPGVIYSLWRLSARKSICTRCGNPYVYKNEIRHLDTAYCVTPSSPDDILAATKELLSNKQKSKGENMGSR